MLLALLASCVDPVAYGATPDDHTNDSPAFQQAIDKAIHDGADVCIGPGVWNLERTPGKVGSLNITGGPLVIRGAGPATVLRMTGRGNRRDWRVLYVRQAHDLAIRDLTIDGLDAYDTEEQTHLIELAPDTHDVALASLTLGPMRQPDQRVGKGIGGDCIRMLGEPGHEVHDVAIVDTRFVDCDRSAIGFQRALADITVAFDTITGTGDAPIDFEPTGRGGIRDVVLTDLEIHNAADGQSAFAITLGGVGADLAERLTVAHSTLDGGGIAMLNVGDVEIVDNTITARDRSREQPTISVIRRGTNIRIAHNTIRRGYAAEQGYVIRAAHNAGIAPSGVTIEDNTIEQGTSMPVIGAISVGGLVVRRNKIDYSAGDPSVAVVQATATISDISGVVIEDNEVRGLPSAVLLATPRGGHVLDAVTVRRNKTEHVAALRCNGKPSELHRVTLDTALPEGTGCNGIALGDAPSPPPPPSPRPAPPPATTSHSTATHASGIVLH